MVENKQVRVDNWGTFFLQRLQTFFNKTDYCDLTLQFDGNVQLKVHRLVMNACTDYFHILEQTCEMVDDVLMMPPDLTPDIILPIVNFMYTGMLEFQMANYQRLYKAAELMEMPVLTKILDAQKSKVAHVKQPRPRAWKNNPDLPATLPGRKLPVWKRKSAPLNVAQQQHVAASSHFAPPEPKHGLTMDPLFLYDNTPKPTRFEWPDEELTNFPLLETSSSFDDISYNSKQILTQEEELRPAGSTFDEVKHLPSLNKKSAKYNVSHIDIEEVKNYVKEQKARTELADCENEEEDVDNDLAPLSGGKRRLDKQGARSGKKLKFNLSEKENVAKPQAGDVNHTKIISEVLRKYPHLVKKNKNIRLKILAKSPNKPETTVAVSAPPPLTPTPASVVVSKPKPDVVPVKKKPSEEGPWICTICSSDTDKVEFVLYYLYRKHMTDVHYEKFDPKQCKFCGHRSTKQALLAYHLYIKHEIKPPPAYSFPKCSQCPYIALTEQVLARHRQGHSKHDVQCSECKIVFDNKSSLVSHVQITSHTGKLSKTSFDCQYCTKRLSTDSHLFSHIKTSHRDEGRRDGIVAIDEQDLEEVTLSEDAEKTKAKPGKDASLDASKIKILSNVKVSSGGAKTNNKETTKKQPLKAEADAEIATSPNLGLVDIVVLDDNQQYILSHSNSQESAESTEYILPQMELASNVNNSNIAQTMLSSNSDIASTDELVMVLTDHDYNDGNSDVLGADNSNIVVLYSHPVEEGAEGQFLTQGNLVLNSQTGLIELRNSADAGAQILTQDESIEMIQREINSHKDFKDPKAAKKGEKAAETGRKSAKIPEENENSSESAAATTATTTTTSSEEVLETKEEVVATQPSEAEAQTEVEDTKMDVEEQSDDAAPQAEEVLIDLADEQERQQESFTVADDDEGKMDVDSQEEKASDQPPEPPADELKPESEIITEIASENDDAEAQDEPVKEPEHEQDAHKYEVTEQDIADHTETEHEVVDLESIEQEQHTEQDVEAESKDAQHQEEQQEQDQDQEQEQEQEQEQDQDQDQVLEVEEDNAQSVENNEQEPEEEVDLTHEEDDNSKMSENTSESVQKDGDPAVQATKIAILHDWEDTDSQQSEQPEGGAPRGENTVNKLITDWEDEDDLKG